MFHTVRIPSIRMLENQLADTRHTIGIAQEAYREQLERCPEDELLASQCDYLTQLRKNWSARPGTFRSSLSPRP